MNNGDFIRLPLPDVTDTEATGVKSTSYITKRCELQYPLLRIIDAEATALAVALQINGSTVCTVSIPTGDRSGQVFRDEEARGLVLEAGDKVELNVTTQSTDDKLFKAELLVRDLYENDDNADTQVEG